MYYKLVLADLNLYLEKYMKRNNRTQYWKLKKKPELLLYRGSILELLHAAFHQY